MSLMLRIILIITSFLLVLLVLRKIHKAKLSIDDAIYWIISAGVLFLISLFPQLVMYVSDFIGFQSPSNFVFLVIIFLIIVKLFTMTIQLSNEKRRLNQLIQTLALRDKDNENK